MSAAAIPKTRLGRQFFRINAISHPAEKTSAIKLPQQLKSVELIFKKRNADGHMGLRKFWHNYLPTIKFYNENLIVNVKRISLSEGVKDVEKARQLESDPQLLAKCPSKIILQYEHNKTEELDCKHKHSDEILAEFAKVAKAQQISEGELIKFNNNVY